MAGARQHDKETRNVGSEEVTNYVMAGEEAYALVRIFEGIVSDERRVRILEHIVSEARIDIKEHPDVGA